MPWDPRDPTDVQEIFGWKTSQQHWNDDAVFGDSDDPFAHPDGWRELRYPLGHPFEGRSIDLAYVITTVPEPATWVLAALALLGGAFLVRETGPRAPAENRCCRSRVTGQERRRTEE